MTGMRTKVVAIVFGAAFGLGAVAACDSKKDQAAVVEAVALPLTVAECEVCGMVVREQPAPRGQLLHRDGTRRFFCSLADLLHYLKAPSSHGAAQHVYVEVLDPAVEPKATSGKAHPWVLASSATYVAGVARPNIMGVPLLAYRTAQMAKTVASRHGGQVKTWQQLQTLPLSN